MALLIQLASGRERIVAIRILCPNLAVGTMDKDFGVLVTSNPSRDLLGLRLCFRSRRRFGITGALHLPTALGVRSDMLILTHTITSYTRKSEQIVAAGGVRLRTNVFFAIRTHCLNYIGVRINIDLNRPRIPFHLLVNFCLLDEAVVTVALREDLVNLGQVVVAVAAGFHFDFGSINHTTPAFCPEGYICKTEKDLLAMRFFTSNGCQTSLGVV